MTKRCLNAEGRFDDDTVEITNRQKCKQQQVARYVCHACGDSTVALVPTAILDDPDFPNRALEFSEALKREGFCDSAIEVAPYNEGNVALSTASPSVVQ